MATSETIRPIESVPDDGFDALQGRFLSLTARFEVLKGVLGNCDNVSNELAPAAFVLRETTEELVELQEDIESWHMEHTPKEVQS